MSKIKAKPNIIILYADDLGFGDVGCYGAQEIPTPNIDSLSREGVTFTQGYATAATCTPSRYSLLTGSYPWRNPRAAILAGDDPLIIDAETPTLPSMLKRAGYATGIVGKWHLGLGRGDLDWNKEIDGVPNHVGFDYSYIMASTNDRVPCVYVKNEKIDGLDPEDPIEVTYEEEKAYADVPTGRKNPELLNMMYSHGHDGSIVNGISRIGYMRGGEKALWKDETMAEVFAEEAVRFIRERKDQPFFLYYAFHQPHVPRVASPKFKGTTSLGPRGDVIAEMDWCVGEVLRVLDEEGLREDTLVIFSSDNGPVIDDGYEDRAAELLGDHRAAGPLRGGKYSLYDGGTRVPFILSWPGTVSPAESDAMVSHMDFHASFASMLGETLLEDEAPDSETVMDALLGKSSVGREALIVEGTWKKTVYRKQQWSYIPPYQGPAICPNTGVELGNASGPQLYDLSGDIGQIRNLAEEKPEVLKQLASELEVLLKG
jgi:arylsulfatase A-like enzyme